MESIHQDLELDAELAEDIVGTSAIHSDLDNTIDDVVDAIDDIDVDENDVDGTDIDTIEGFEDEEIDIHADSEPEAAELELLSDMDNPSSDDDFEYHELEEGYHITTDLIEIIQEAYNGSID